MRLFLFVLLLSAPAIAVPPNCDHTDIVAGANLNTCTSLIINSPVNLTASGGGTIEITAITGNVEINANITLDGGNGTLLTADNTVGVNGGPGAFGGGGISGSLAEPGQGLSGADGSAGINDPACGSGGGAGAGANDNGEDGFACNGGASTSPGGITPGFPAPFAGGFGGGAGGEKQTAVGPPAVFDLGGGGGGGGAILIQATGSITIANGVTISARGGNGGNSLTIGGGGGGGGGGTIHLISATAINNQGILDVSGGTGGSSASGGVPRGGVGGAGGSGIIRLDVNGTVNDFTGRQDFSTGGTAVTSRSSLNSDISCGTIAPKNDTSSFFLQSGFAFVLILAFGEFLKFLKNARDRKTARHY